MGTFVKGSAFHGKLGFELHLVKLETANHLDNRALDIGEACKTELDRLNSGEQKQNIMGVRLFYKTDNNRIPSN